MHISELRIAGASLRRYDALSRKLLHQRAWELKRGRKHPGCG